MSKKRSDVVSNKPRRTLWGDLLRDTMPYDPELPTDIDILWDALERINADIRLAAQEYSEHLKWAYPDDAYKRRALALEYQKVLDSNPARAKILRQIHAIKEMATQAQMEEQERRGELPPEPKKGCPHCQAHRCVCGE